MATNRTSPKKGKVVDIPTAPTIGTATAGAESATVAYTAATVGGAATTFTALSNPGSITGTGTSPITVSGLTGGTAYTFTVRGTNATGSSEYSSASGSVTPTVNTSFESIATVTLSSSAASISFSSIPSTYTHLQLRGISKAASSGSPFAYQIRFNGDSAANYTYHRLIGNGSAASAVGTTGASQISCFYEPTNEANVFAGGVIDILDYTNTNKNTVVKTLGGYDANGSGYATFFSGVWLNTAAITSITLITESATNTAQYSSFALYGIKGA